MASDTLAYAPFEATNWVAWNPATFSIIGDMQAPSSIPLTRDGLNVVRGYGHDVSGKYAYQTYYCADATYSQTGAISQIGIVDITSNTVAGTPEVPCPHMHIATKDDDGNLYFSNGQYSVPPAVLDPEAPKNCIARIKAGQTTLDGDFTIHFADLADLAEGREGGNFFYVGDGVGFFNVYHAERDDIGPDTEASAIMNSSNYHLWTLDLKTMKAGLMPDIDYAGGQYTAFRIDGRAFVAMPKGDYSSTTIYEVLPNGTAQKRFDVQGWTFNVFRVR